MALPVIMFLRIFTSLGMNIATVQSRELTPALVSSLFWLHLALGLAMTVITLLPSLEEIFILLDAGSPISIQLVDRSDALAPRHIRVVVYQCSKKLDEIK